MDVNFEYYKIFYYVAKYNNFTRAARVLGNSQPNVTRAMNCLEQQLHCTLLVRTNRGVFLTTEGEKLYTHVAAAMEQLFTAEEELAECVGLSHGSIAIGASETALNLFLLDKLKEFHNTYPGIRLKIYNHSTPQAVEAVRRGTVDFAVSFHTCKSGCTAPHDNASSISGNTDRWNRVRASGRKGKQH